jgi:hypothetical protein
LHDKFVDEFIQRYDLGVELPAGTSSDGTATIRALPERQPFPARRQHRHPRTTPGV